MNVRSRKKQRPVRFVLTRKTEMLHLLDDREAMHRAQQEAKVLLESDIPG